MTPEVQIFLMQMPGKVNECVTHNADGSYTIFINESLGQVARMNAYHHAMTHIENYDFEKYNSDEIEFNAHFEPDHSNA